MQVYGEIISGAQDDPVNGNYHRHC